MKIRNLMNTTSIKIFVMSAVALFATCGRAAAAYELPDGTVTCATLDVRRDASGGSAAFWKLKRGASIKIKAINGEFYKVKLTDDKEGYVHNTCLDVTVWAKVVNTGAWMHTTPASTADVVADLRNLAWVRITNRWRNWYEVTLNDRRTHGWVEESALQAPAEFFAAWLAFNHPSPIAPDSVAASANNGKYRSRYLEETEGSAARHSNNYDFSRAGSMDYSNISSLRYNIISYAKGFLGTPYVYGGSSPSGFDCSGFVNYVFKNNGVSIARNSRALAEQGSYIAPSNLQPGDLVFFGPGGSSINHVGIYIGGGNFIHASSSGKSGSYVRISPLEGHYSTRYVTARRILP